VVKFLIGAIFGAMYATYIIGILLSSTRERSSTYTSGGVTVRVSEIPPDSSTTGTGAGTFIVH
jgi:hypothetical protein